MSLLTVKDLKKENDVVALRDITFSIEEKGVYGFFGKSGSGKTLLASLLGGLVDADSGEIIFRDKDLCASSKNALMSKRKIGYIPDKCHFPQDLTMLELLDFTGKAKKVDPDKRARQIKEALELTGMTSKAHKLIKELTPSEKKRLAYANALLANPDMIIIDEPLAIIDSAQKDGIKKLIAMLGRMKVVLLFSRRTSDIEELCSRAGILNSGELVAFAPIEELMSAVNKNVMATIRIRTRAVDKNSIMLSLSSVKQILKYEVLTVGSTDISVKAELSTRDLVSQEVDRAVGAVGAELMSIKYLTFTLDDVIDILSDSNGYNNGDEGREEE